MYSKNVFSESRPFRLQIGMILSLTVVLLAFEWKSYGERELVGLMGENTNVEDSVMTPVTFHEPPPPPPKTTTPIIKTVEDEEEIEEIKISFLEEFDEGEVLEPVFVPEIEEEEEEIDGNHVFVGGLEFSAEPVGGLSAFYKFIGKNLKYPKPARRMNIQGKVIIQFIVEKDGSFSDFQVLRGIGSGCDEEALRILKKSKKWKPAKQRGKPVRQRMVIPIHFKLK